MRTFHLILLLAGVATVSGCTTVKFVELREKPKNPITKRLSLSSFGDAGPSERTSRFLAATSYSGGEGYLEMLRHCRSQRDAHRDREALHALAEISYLAAAATSRRDPGLAMELFLDAAEHSWNYIVDAGDGQNIADINSEPHRETVEIYNTSLEKLLRLTEDSGDYRIGRTVQLPVSRRLLNLEVPFPTNWLSEDQLGEFEFVSDYELRNLRNRHSSAGIGVPIMVRRRRQPDQVQLEKYYEDRLSFPVTVVARFPSKSPPADDTEPIRLQLLDPRESDGIVVKNALLPLESDLSTPLAWFLTDPKKSLLETLALIRPDKTKHLEGLYMITPYDPDRIPVLMVHGLWSSPVTWMEMFNDLQSDPQLRDKYQFWFYMYPTGEPLTFAAANLRDRLKEVRQRCDPYGQNRNLDQMVMVGHSMGGLMSYLMTVESEDKLWTAMSKIPVNEIEGDAEVHSQIRRVFFFEQDRSIDRLVTIASPFNGSGYANRFTQWLSGSIISLPNTTSRLSQLIFRQNNQSIRDRMFTPRTSLDSLNKNSAIVKLVNHTTIPADVPHHNVVGVSSGKSLSDWTDGVVKLRSASRPNATSELRVKASHSAVHRHPETIAEVRRVLLEHLKEVRRRRYPVVPIRHETRPDEHAAFSPRSESASERQLAP